MKKLFMLVAFCAPVLLFVQCKKQPANGYEINVTVEGEPTQALLTRTVGEENVTDTAALKEGVFVFEGVADEPSAASLVVHFATEEGARARVFHTSVILEPGVITVTIPEQWAEATISGTITNDENNRWNDTIAPIRAQAQAVDAEFRSLTPEEQKSRLMDLRERYTALQDRIDNMAAEYVAANPDSWFALNSLFSTVVGGQDADKAQEVLNGFSERIRGTKLGRERQEMIDAWRAVAVGAVAPDFAQPDPDGKEIKLSDLRGKWVLVDFWASWCGPCRQENPNVVAAFNAFKDKGFTVFGVSLDSNKEAWIKAIADDKLDWPQVSDVKGWGNAAAKLYSVRSIPANFLLNPEGVIVARNLRAEALHEELAKNLDAAE